MTAAATLRAVIFETLGDAPGRTLEGQFMLWCSAPRFRTFAATYADKIRKKLRVVRDDEGLQDVQLELEVAARLLRDRRFAVEYEKHATSGRRHPDLSVRFREGAVLHLEVKRVRTVEADLEAKCAEVICEAVPQLVPNALNVIAIALSEERAPVVDMARALRALRASRAEGRGVLPAARLRRRARVPAGLQPPECGDRARRTTSRDGTKSARATAVVQRARSRARGRAEPVTTRCAAQKSVARRWSEEQRAASTPPTHAAECVKPVVRRSGSGGRRQ